MNIRFTTTTTTTAAARRTLTCCSGAVCVRESHNTRHNRYESSSTERQRRHRLCKSTPLLLKQGVALTGRNRTVGRPTAHAPGSRPACPPAALQTTTDDEDRRWRQTTDASEQNNTDPLGGPIITIRHFSLERLEVIMLESRYWPSTTTITVFK